MECSVCLKPIRPSPVAEVVRRLLAGMADELAQNEAGAGAGEEIVFLHDCRVAVRSARVIVSQCRNFIPADAAGLFSTEL